MSKPFYPQLLQVFLHLEGRFLFSGVRTADTRPFCRRRQNAFLWSGTGQPNILLTPTKCFPLEQAGPAGEIRKRLRI